MGRYVVGITGASGALYARRVCRAILAGGHECHVCCTPYGQRLLHDELGIERLDREGLASFAWGGAAPEEGERSRLILHATRDVGAPIASGSFRHDGMVIVPCSSHTMNSIAMGVGDTIVTRAAAVCLKERRPLVIAHRESPLTLIDIRAMETLTLAGAVIAPCNPGLYLMPTSLEEIVDFVSGRLLDLLKIEHEVGKRWGERAADGSGRV
ncbi:MAG: UbiX family flavin prenyltransferase [Phycisphaerae bacterium]|nr:UbiX family flavin prenyltransferase [Phycisphaerae bacterium]